MKNVEIYDDEISLRDYIEVLLRRKSFIILSVAAFIIAAMSYSLLTSPPTLYVTQQFITLNFPGIEKHKNPDGSGFSKEQIIAPHILDTVSNSLTPKTRKTENIEEVNLRESISIQPYIPPLIVAAQEKFEENVKKRGEKVEEYVYYPNQFTIRLTLKDNNILSFEKRGDVLRVIVEEYEKDFRMKYVESPGIITELPEDSIRKQEYGDLIALLKSNIFILRNFLASKEKQGVSFKSAESGLEFKTIKSEVIKIDKNLELFSAHMDNTPFAVVEIPENVVDDYHYDTVVSILKSRMKSLNSFIDSKIKAGGLFFPSSSGLTFLDMKNASEIIEVADLSKYDNQRLAAIEVPEKITDKYHYQDVLSFLKIRTEEFKGFLGQKIEKTGEFRSAKTGRSFIDLKNDIELMELSQLSKYDGQPLAFFQIPENILKKHHYDDAISIIRNRVQEFKGFLDGKIKKTGFYQSDRSGLSFRDIKRDLDLIETTQLNKYDGQPLTFVSIPENVFEKYHYKDALALMKTRIQEFRGFLDNRIKKTGFYQSRSSGLSFGDIKKDLNLLADVKLSQYTDHPLLFVKVPEDIVDSFDYPDAISLIKNRIQNLKGFIDARIKQSGFFKSRTLGIDFSDIKNDVDLIKEIDVGEMDAEIQLHVLTKNPEALLSRTQLELKNIETLLSKKEGEARIAENLMDRATNYEVFSQHAGGGSVPGTGSYGTNNPLPKPEAESSESAGTVLRKNEQPVRSAEPGEGAQSTAGEKPVENKTLLRQNEAFEDQRRQVPQRSFQNPYPYYNPWNSQPPFQMQTEDVLKGLVLREDKSILLKKTLDASVFAHKLRVDKKIKEEFIASLEKKISELEKGKLPDKNLIREVEKGLVEISKKNNHNVLLANKLYLEFLEKEMIQSPDQQLSLASLKDSKKFVDKKKVEEKITDSQLMLSMEKLLNKIVIEANKLINRANRLNLKFLAQENNLTLSPAQALASTDPAGEGSDEKLSISALENSLQTITYRINNLIRNTNALNLEFLLGKDFLKEEMTDSELNSALEGSFITLIKKINGLTHEANELNLEFLAKGLIPHMDTKKLNNVTSVQGSLRDLTIQFNDLSKKTNTLNKEFIEYRLVNLIKDLNFRGRQANDLNHEFLTIQFSVPSKLAGVPHAFTQNSLQQILFSKKIIIVAVAALFLSVFIAFFGDYWKRSGEEKRGDDKRKKFEAANGNGNYPMMIMLDRRSVPGRRDPNGKNYESITERRIGKKRRTDNGKDQTFIMVNRESK